MYYKILLLIALIPSCNSKDSVTTNNLDGNWTPLILLSKNGKFCEQKGVKIPFSVEIKNNGKRHLKACNTTVFEYSVFKKSILIRDYGGLRTMILCQGLPGEIENFWPNEWNYKTSLNGDSLTLFKYDEDVLIKLIKTELFDSTSYIKFYYSNKCKWTFEENSRSQKLLDGEPIYDIAEVLPQLCSGQNPQEIIANHLYATERMKRLDIYDRVSLRIKIDKCGLVRGFDGTADDYLYDGQLYNLLQIMSCWKPAYIDDRPVNSYYPLLFDFRKLK